MISPLKVAAANANLEFKSAYIDIEQECGAAKQYSILSLWNAEDEVHVDVKLYPRGETEFEEFPDGTECQKGTLSMRFDRQHSIIEQIVQQLVR